MTNRKFKNLPDFNQNEITELKDGVYQIADGYQKLKRLNESVKNPDLSRLLSNMEEVYNSSLSYYLEKL